MSFLLTAASQQKISAPVSSWDYEGVMTVGDFFSFIFGLYRTGLFFGSIIPTPPIIDNTEIGAIFYNQSENSLNIYNMSQQYMTIISEIEINGVSFPISGGKTLVISNPFPPVGQTCTIKIKI